MRKQEVKTSGENAAERRIRGLMFRGNVLPWTLADTRIECPGVDKLLGNENATGARWAGGVLSFIQDVMQRILGLQNKFVKMNGFTVIFRNCRSSANGNDPCLGCICSGNNRPTKNSRSSFPPGARVFIH